MAETGSILVPVDLHEGAGVALAYAGELAARLRLPLHLLHVWEVPLYASAGLAIGLAGAGARRTLDELARAEAERGLSALIERTPLPEGVAVTRAVRYGDAAEVILDEAARARPRLVVMATHGRRGVERFLLGSVTAKVIRRAPCPVLTVPIPHHDQDQDHDDARAATPGREETR